MTELDRNQQRDSHMRVAMVDDTSLYSKKLIEGFARLGTSCVLYGPLSTIRSKSQKIMVTLGPHAVRVWSQSWFPFQILKRALKDKPDLVHFQFEFYGIHSYGPIYASIGLPILLLLLHSARVKTLVTLHSILPPESSQISKLRDASPISKRIPILLVKTFLVLSYKMVGLLSDGMIVHAKTFRNRLVEQYHVDRSKIMVVPHGVDPYNATAPQNLTGGTGIRKRILCFGVISPRKGIENLLSAFAILNDRRDDCELLLAGSSPPYYHEYDLGLKDQAVLLGLSHRVRFIGEVDDEEAHRLFEQARFAILPYSYAISASGVLSWAIGHAVPVIVSENEYFREELSQCEFGLMVTPGKPESLADAMDKLLRREDLCVMFSQNARKTGISRSWNAVAIRTIECYDRILSRNESSNNTMTGKE